MDDKGENYKTVETKEWLCDYKRHFNVYSVCGCSTKLLDYYMECKLCQKFSFPDFRLVDEDKSVALCETCSETILNLCGPSPPENLIQPQLCIVTDKLESIGHRLVLNSPSQSRRWVSANGVAKIEERIKRYSSLNPGEYSNLLVSQLRSHLLSVVDQIGKMDRSLHVNWTVLSGFILTDKEAVESATPEAILPTTESGSGFPVDVMRQPPTTSSTNVIGVPDATRPDDPPLTEADLSDEVASRVGSGRPSPRIDVPKEVAKDAEAPGPKYDARQNGCVVAAEDGRQQYVITDAEGNPITGLSESEIKRVIAASISNQMNGAHVGDSNARPPADSPTQKRVSDFPGQVENEEESRTEEPTKKKFKLGDSSD